MKMVEAKLAVLASTEAHLNKASVLSNALGCLALTPPLPDTITHALIVDDKGLSLQCMQPVRMRPIQADFCSLAHAKRFHPQAWRKELIARVCGFKQNTQPRLLDATGGFGDDAFALASLGASVTVLERSPIMHALLNDALEKAKKRELPGALRMQLLHADALPFLEQCTTPFDVIYLDPMYPDPDKRALVKKRCRAIRDLVGDDLDANALLSLALTNSPRVVVKRPRLAPLLTDRKPSDSLLGKSIRFDLYLNPTL